MNESDDEFFERLQTNLRSSAIALAEIQKLESQKIREQTTVSYGQLNNAHSLLSGVIGALLFRVNGKMYTYDSKNEQVDSLCAVFVIGMKTCEEALIEGAYLQALNLLRQEMELLAQVKNVVAGKREANRSPNVAGLEETVRRLYSNLSEAAHLATHTVASMATSLDLSQDAEFPEGTIGIRYFPLFDELLSRRGFALHLLLMHYIVYEIASNYTIRFGANPLTEEDKNAIKLALSFMKAEKMIE